MKENPHHGSSQDVSKRKIDSRIERLITGYLGCDSEDLMKAIITVIGKDKVGIMYKVSGILNERGVNIEDVTQTIMQEYFTMLMLVKIDEARTGFRELQEALEKLGEDNGLSIRIQKEEIFDTMHKI